VNCSSKTETDSPYAAKRAKLRPNMAQVLTTILKILLWTIKRWKEVSPLKQVY